MAKIKILDKAVALKIAAGEVIDRPASVLRELLDNSIDAQSSEISVVIESSGMKEISVSDNGIGMSKDDLQLSILQHATSKIETAEDLYKLHTLGFRGEALSSILSSSRLKIVTSTNSSDGGWVLESTDSSNISISKSAAKKGTSIFVRDLFYSIPARKQFLKNPASETTLCKTVFLEKAAAKPELSFKFSVDGNLIYTLPASGLKERILNCYQSAFQNIKMMYEINETDFGKYKIKGIIADPSLFRRDRKYIHIYVNGRRIQEYSLIQAVTYGFSEFMPGGHFPSAVIFIEDSPELVDFNIHPAKKEAKLKNLPQIHHSVTELIKSELDKSSPAAAIKSGNYQADKKDFSSLKNYPKTIQNILFTENQKSPGTYSDNSYKQVHTSGNFEKEQTKKFYNYNPVSFAISENASENKDNKINYLGQIFDMFILCEKDDSLFIIDQHAAHEKSLYESYISQLPKIQKLLIPVYFEEDTQFSKKMLKDYKNAGIIIEKDDSGNFFIDSLPDILSNIKKDIKEIILKSPGNIDEVKKNLFATASCKAAVKAGEKLSKDEAIAIIDSAFSLDSPYCPHGRPVWKKITKIELLEQISRIV